MNGEINGRDFVTGLLWLAAALLVHPLRLLGGPPFVTDDPEPVEYRHWEFYVASQDAKTAEDWSGTAPHFEVNYGVIRNLQLHLLAPLAYDSPTRGSRHYGYGDTELGAKYRFLQETARLPQAGIFPLLEIPTGNADDNLGSGHVQAFLPVWLQKSWGTEDRAWTVYGGGGYHINPGAGNHDWGFFGMVLQRQIRKNVLIGGELSHSTVAEAGGRTDTAFNLGTVVDFSDDHHLLFSAGRSIHGPTQFQLYVAYQFTCGP
ncbi:MAG TPA: hypothetical protein VL486_07335 [Verrucomicrobiae bacterium]|nr:hypothetical protein [Verrucomicrobiae bacterium]